MPDRQNRRPEAPAAAATVVPTARAIKRGVSL